MPDNLTISISADTTKLRAELEVAQAELKKFGSTAREAAKAWTTTGDMRPVTEAAKNVEQATQRVSLLRRELSEAHRTVANASPWRQMTGALGEINKATREFGASLVEMADRVIPHFREVLALASVYGLVEFVRQTKEAADAIVEMNESAKDLGVTVQEFQAIQLAGARAGVEDFTGGLARLRREIGQARIEAARTSGADLGGIVMRGGRGVQLGDAPGVGVLRGGQLDPLVQQGTALEKLRINVSNYKNTFEDSAKLYRDISTALSNIADGSVKAQIAGELFGREWPKYVRLLKDFAINADLAAKSLKSANVEIGESTILLAENFKTHWATMSTVAGNAWKIISSILGQLLLPLMDAVSAAIGINMRTWKEWAEAFVQSVGPVVQDLANYIRSWGNIRPQTAWGKTIIETFEGIARAAKLTFEIISLGFKGLVEIANVVTGAVNYVFGTSFSGIQIVLTALALRFLGFFRVVATGFDVIYRIVRPLVGWFRTLAAVIEGVAAGISWPALIIAGLVALSLAIATTMTNWQELQKVVLDFGNSVAAIMVSLVSTITTLWDSFFSWIEEKFNWIAQKVSDAIAAISNAVSQAGNLGADTGSAPNPAGLFARGGRVPGTGSGDTVPAMLTPGEFVARQSSVRYYGADVFHAMNARLIPRDMFRGFGYALGGLVDSIHRPAHFADGGMVPAAANVAPVHLHLGSREFVTHASPAVAAALLTAAKYEQMRSAGKKPSWVS